MARNKKKKKGSKKIYLITFLLTLIMTLLIFGSATAIYIKSKEERYKQEIEEAIQNEKIANKTEDDKNEDEDEDGDEDDKKSILEIVPDLNTLDGLISVSKRTNILLIGTDGGRADTIILASYEPDNHLLDLVTVPRDTYHPVPGYNLLGQKKINAVYGFGYKDGGGDGMKTQVSQILGVPIHYYVVANYQSISAIVNTVGGVEINIEQSMHYDDPYCNPPLHIHFEPGLQTLNGQQAMEYLRWRKNNGFEGAGDVPRTQRQIDFVKRLIRKSISSFKYDEIIRTCYQYVSTDMPIKDVLIETTTLFGFQPENDIESYLLPGEAYYDDLSYYRVFSKETEEMMIEIYKKGLVEDDENDDEDDDEDDKDNDDKDDDDKDDNKKIDKDKKSKEKKSKNQKKKDKKNKKTKDKSKDKEESESLDKSGDKRNNF